jgi:dTDP-4-amino-4,6-dideoxygalactose transaminase
MIPLVDLKAQYASIKAEVDRAVHDVLDNAAFIGGEGVAGFEESFAAYCEAKACVGVANGTDALFLALKALGVGPGHEVITVAHTFIATTEAINAVGATPVFVDVQPDTMLMNASLLEAAVTRHTKAIIAVHLYGQPVDMAAVTAVARRHHLRVIEDGAQAHGARYQGKRVGTLGDVATFSFYPGKNLGAYGDGGAVVSQDVGLAEEIRMLANHGRKRKEKYVHQVVGFNSRLDALQAAVLTVKLRHLDAWNQARREHAAAYVRALAHLPVQLPGVHPQTTPVWHLFVARMANRDGVSAALEKQGIHTGVHYPTPLHLQPAYHGMGIPRGALPVTEATAGSVLSLPMYPELTQEQLELVVAALAAALEGTG